jgi:hypothetical protein
MAVEENIWSSSNTVISFIAASHASHASQMILPGQPPWPKSCSWPNHLPTMAYLPSCGNAILGLL